MIADLYKFILGLDCAQKKEIIQNIKLFENRFGFEPEITAKIAKLSSDME